MIDNKTTIKRKIGSIATVSSLLAVSLVGISFPSYAQGLSAGQAGLLDQSKGLNPDHDQLLPPAVVPIDPGANGKIAPASAREVDLEVSNTGSAYAPGAAPAGHMNLNPANSGYMSHQERRQALFNSFMQQGNNPNSAFTSQYNNLNYGQMQANGFGQMQPQTQPQMQGQFASPQLAQPDWLATQAQNNVSAMGNVGPTQTLTASSRNPIVRRDTRRGGFANNLAGTLSLGSGLLTGGLKRPNSIMGLGTTALFMTGFGRR